MSQDNALVSVIVPIYNAAAHLEKSLESIASQDYPELEIILVDDGSKDESYALCQKLAAKDRRIRVYHTENRGSGPARNCGIDHATGKYAYFPDADDLVDPGCISAAVRAMNGGEYDLVVFGFRMIGRDGKLLSSQDYPAFGIDGNSVRLNYGDYVSAADSCYAIQGAPWNKLFDLETIRKYQIRYPDMRRHQDEAFIARYVCCTDRIYFLNQNLYTYFANDLRKVWEKYPVSYLDIVYRLREDRLRTIYTWNSKDNRTHRMLDKEYLWGVLTACEIQFSPKAGLSAPARKEKIRGMLEEAKVSEVAVPRELSRYRRIVLRLADKRLWDEVYLLMWIKLRLEMSGLVDAIKNWKK